jgi:hypothetical protein
LISNQGRMAIDGHGRQEPLPLPSRAYISTPRAPPHPLHTHSSFHAFLALTRPCHRLEHWPPRHCRRLSSLAGLLHPQPSSPPPPLKFSIRC